jgi:polyhydroxyalkanoate synthesis regulator phasin
MSENEKSSLEKIILAGVGAITKTAETAGELLEELVKKGELTVEQGKAINEELKYELKEKVNNVAESVQGSVVSGFVANMDKLTPEELAKVRERIDELESVNNTL